MSKVTWRRHLAWAAFAGASLGAGAATASLAQECVDCHAEVVNAFGTTPHGRSFAHGPDGKDAACVSCHVGAAEHAAAGGDPAKVANPAKQAGRAADASCLSCHQNTARSMFWDGSAHDVANVRCGDCHSVHGLKPARAAGPAVRTTSDMCVSCHTSQRKHLNQRSTHPLREGKMSCASCHDPHGSPAAYALKSDSVNDLCYSCHENVRGPFLWEHAPVREDCLTCHTPHGSNHDKMLVARTVQICQNCHQQGRHQTLPGLPDSIWVANRSCTNCHSQVHGSNHPSGPLFQR